MGIHSVVCGDTRPQIPHISRWGNSGQPVGDTVTTLTPRAYGATSSKTPLDQRRKVNSSGRVSPPPTVAGVSTHSKREPFPIRRTDAATTEGGGETRSLNRGNPAMRQPFCHRLLTEVLKNVEVGLPACRHHGTSSSAFPGRTPCGGRPTEPTKYLDSAPVFLRESHVENRREPCPAPPRFAACSSTTRSTRSALRARSRARNWRYRPGEPAGGRGR